MVKAANHALPCWWGRRSDNTQNTQNTHDTHIYQHNHPQKPKSWLLVTQACQLPSSPSRLPAVYLAAKEGQPQGEHLLSPSPHPQLSEPEPETPPLLPHPPAVQTCDWTRSDRPWTGLQCFGVLQNAGALQHVTIQRCRQPGLQACESIWGNNVASCNITTVTTVTFDHLQNIQFSSSFKPVSPIIQYAPMLVWLNNPVPVIGSGSTNTVRTFSPP